MPGLDPFQEVVSRVALETARKQGFALAGSNALAAHGIISRATEDIDLFTDIAGAVEAAAAHVADALTAAGFTVKAVAGVNDLGEIFEGFAQEMVEYEVSRGDQTVRLQLVRFNRSRAPLQMDVGPVLHLDDILGSKVAALATRAEPRDYLDVAEALHKHSREHLVDLAHRADPDLSDAELAEAMQRLDRLDDVVFEEQYRLSRERIERIRAAFSGWPRSGSS